MKRLFVLYFDTSNVTIDDLLKSPYLSNKDKLSFEKYKNEETKKEKIVSAIFKNKYIGKYKINENGKPISENRFFNISHSHGLVVFIEDVVPVGIDIEQIRAVKNDLIDFVSNKEEFIEIVLAKFSSLIKKGVLLFSLDDSLMSGKILFCDSLSFKLKDDSSKILFIDIFLLLNIL